MTATVATEYRADVESALRSGGRVRSLYVGMGGRSVRVLLEGPSGETRVVTADVSGAGEVASIVDLAPAMAWDEREAHDLHGIRFSGHHPLRPLVDHAASLDVWTVPVRGHDPYQVAVGPIHAGVIESGHFRFHVVGDRVLHLDARLFYKHRGLERAALGLPLAAGLPVISRACAACSVANGVAYATAAEQLLGLRAEPELARARVMLLELERTWTHLNDVAAICAGVGMAAGTSLFLALTEQARRLNARLTGHRFLAGSVEVGRNRIAFDGATAATVREELRKLRTEAEVGWHALSFNASFQDRLEEIGVIDAATAARRGGVGPAARAAGIAEDARATSPYPDYLGFEPAVQQEGAGDVQARFRQRMIELRQTLDLLDRVLDDGPLVAAGAVTEQAVGGEVLGDDQGGERVGVGIVESPRGATSCVVESTGGTIGRVRLRTGSYANWPAVAEAAAGGMLPDFPLINKSFELCYACADR